ncbi:hypothetical protein CDL12_00691 [Handroanthus impetiginosus]|uniref:Non-specific serine/threonine protein kinase n=1 Tax=Handroanthus impetiginosus TaxID=429701 RepID=A0A2G9I9W9_9LAMI|nr:hypothetical protein CDL12_00691 [Handroanthus impetiginosus]
MKRLSWFIFQIMSYAFIWSYVEASEERYTQESLNSLLYDYAIKSLRRPRTGVLYNVSLPYNLSGMEVSIIRLRTHRLWKNGVKFSSFEIPPRLLPRPFTNRVDLVYQNLGNWSSFYYNVPNYTFVAPVIGFLAYDSNTSSINHELLDLNLSWDNPVIIRFPNVSFDVRMKCVRFTTNGTLEFTNLSEKNSCTGRSLGHFSIVVPYEPTKKEKKRVIKWWMIAIAAGYVGLLLIFVCGIVGYKLFKWQRVKKMEKESEISEGLDTVWVGESRMPSAPGTRTEPVLENSYVP